MPYTYEFPRPALAADCALFTSDQGVLKLLLIRRGAAPFEGMWALPGGFIHIDEAPEDAARRELEEETGLSVKHVAQLGAWGRPDRDPRDRVVSVAHLAVTRLGRKKPQGADDAANAQWFDADDLPGLAFDHDEIVATARASLEGLALCSTMLFGMAPKTFPICQLRQLLEQILGREINRETFRRKMLVSGFLEVKGKRKDPETGRGVKLFSLSGKARRELNNGECIIPI